MNSNQAAENTEEFSEKIEVKNAVSVDDFIKQLEAKEKDLHISADLIIEIDESDFDEEAVPEFVRAELLIEKEKTGDDDFSNQYASAAEQKTYSELADEISRLETQMTKLEAERHELSEGSQRRQKDFDSYKSRTERERSETFSNQISNLAGQILPVLDNLDRALDFAADMSDEKQKEIRQLFEGLVLVNQQLSEVLAGMGVQPIASVGERFDPHFHEAVAIEESDQFPPQTISGELLRGYRIGEKVIRPSMVKVSTSVSRKAAESAPETATPAEIESPSETKISDRTNAASPDFSYEIERF